MEYSILSGFKIYYFPLIERITCVFDNGN